MHSPGSAAAFPRLLMIQPIVLLVGNTTAVRSAPSRIGPSSGNHFMREIGSDIRYARRS